MTSYSSQKNYAISSRYALGLAAKNVFKSYMSNVNTRKKDEGMARHSSQEAVITLIIPSVMVEGLPSILILRTKQSPKSLRFRL